MPGDVTGGQLAQNILCLILPLGAAHPVQQHGGAVADFIRSAFWLPWGRDERVVYNAAQLINDALVLVQFLQLAALLYQPYPEYGVPQLAGIGIPGRAEELEERAQVGAAFGGGAGGQVAVEHAEQVIPGQPHTLFGHNAAQPFLAFRMPEIPVRVAEGEFSHLLGEDGVREFVC